MGLTPYTTILASGVKADSDADEVFDAIPTRGRSGLLLVTDVADDTAGAKAYLVSTTGLTLPVTIDSTHNQFEFSGANGNEWIVASGTYNTAADLAAAVQAALLVADGVTPLSSVLTCTASDATHLRLESVATGANTDAVGTGAANDCLARLGYADGDALAHGDAAADWSLQVTIAGIDATSGKVWTILQGAALADSLNAPQVLRVHPAITPVTNVAASDLLPETIRVTVTHDSTAQINRSYTLSLVS